VKRIAYLTPLYFADESVVGGGERYPVNLAVGVAEAGRGEFSVDVISYGPRGFRHELHPGVTLRVLPLAHPPRNPLDPVSWGMPEIIADTDLIHVHQAYTRQAEVAIVLAKVFGKPVCVTDHGGASSRIGIEFGSLDLADRVVCQSEFAARMLRTTAPVAVVKGGVDADHFRPPDTTPARDRVLFVGRLLPHKGIDQLIDALPPGLPLTVCGRPYRADYYEVLQRLAAGKRVEFRTEATDDEIRDLYGRAWATVLPSVYRDFHGHSHVQPELMGFALLESMACGTPAVCSRVGGMPEFVRHGRTGFVFDEVGELTRYLAALASDPGLAMRMGREARRLVEREFDRRVCGEKLVALYRELIAGGRVAGRRAA
jgi:glycosyltransferase involved in cell wall biosynthesis